MQQQQLFCRGRKTAIVVSNFHQRDAIGVSTKLAILGIELLARSTNYGNLPFQQLSKVNGIQSMWKCPKICWFPIYIAHLPLSCDGQFGQGSKQTIDLQNILFDAVVAISSTWCRISSPNLIHPNSSFILGVCRDYLRFNLKNENEDNSGGRRRGN